MRRRNVLGAVLAGLAATAILLMFVFPTVIVDLLSPDSVAIDLEGKLDTERRLSLPPTTGHVQLEFEPVAVAPQVEGATRQQNGLYLITSCESGCSIVLKHVPLGTQAVLRITYLAGDSEYLDDIDFG